MNGLPNATRYGMYAHAMPIHRDSSTSASSSMSQSLVTVTVTYPTFLPFTKIFGNILFNQILILVFL